MGEIKTGVSLLSDKETNLVGNSLIISKINLIPNEYKPYLEEIQALLIELDNLGLLDTFNNESIDLVEIIWLNYYQLPLLKPQDFVELSLFEIMKYILIPYNGKHCEKESELYEYQCKFESLIFALKDILKQQNNPIMCELLRKYNENLYNLVCLLAELCGLLKENNCNRCVIKNVIRMFGVYYFTQEDLNCDLQIFKRIITNIINNSNYFIKYCLSGGVFMYPTSQEEIDSTYQSILDYLQSKIEEEKEKNRK